mmetsp:Transcript_10184/g.28391  ORF Transcript_10184/g.28391 Transcript_10184/m.28391 type:complete len:313 (-) Transcript_10184:1041-1979(-)
MSRQSHLTCGDVTLYPSYLACLRQSPTSMAATPASRHANSGAVKCFNNSRGTISYRPFRIASSAGDFVTRSSLCLACSLTYSSLFESVTVFLDPPGTNSVSTRLRLIDPFDPPSSPVRSTTDRAFVSGFSGNPSVFATATSTARATHVVRARRSTRNSDSSIARARSACMDPLFHIVSFECSICRTQCVIRVIIGTSDGFRVSDRVALAYGSVGSVSSSPDPSPSSSNSEVDEKPGTTVSSSSTEKDRHRFSTPLSMSRTIPMLLATSGAISSRSSHPAGLPSIPFRNALEKDTGNGDWCNTQYPKIHPSAP